MVFAMNSILEFLPEKQLREILKNNDLENEKIENRLKLIKDWLVCEDYLPNIVDVTVLTNFLYGCKANLEKTKFKLEKYLIAKTKMTMFFNNREIITEDHTIYPHYRCFYASKKQSESGNRVIVMRAPSANLDGFSFLQACKYMLLGFDFLLYFDKSVKYDFIYDGGNFTGPFMAKINFTIAKNIFEMIYNILPYRTNSISVINTTPGFDLFLNVAKPLMPKKIKDRMKNIKVTELTSIVPLECLPEDYGGKAEKLNDRSQEIFDFLIKNAIWCRETENLKLSGALPENKRQLYSFEEFAMDGSFRSLSID